MGTPATAPPGLFRDPPLPLGMGDPLPDIPGIGANPSYEPGPCSRQAARVGSPPTHSTPLSSRLCTPLMDKLRPREVKSIANACWTQGLSPGLSRAHTPPLILQPRLTTAPISGPNPWGPPTLTPDTPSVSRSCCSALGTGSPPAPANTRPRWCHPVYSVPVLAVQSTPSPHSPGYKASPTLGPTCPLLCAL